MSTSAVTEQRTFTVRCARKVAEDCDPHRVLRMEETGISSLAKAEKQFRDDGWKLHTDGRASCPQCIKAWEGE